MLALRHVARHAFALELQLGQLELCVLVVEEDRRVVEIVRRALGIGLKADLGQAAAHVARQRRQRLRHERCTPVVVGIDVGVVVGDLLVEHVRLGVVGMRALIVGIDARQIELGEEVVLRSRHLERGNRHLVVAARIGADALLQSLFRRAELPGDAGTGRNRCRRRQQSKRQSENTPRYPHNSELQPFRRGA